MKKILPTFGVVLLALLAACQMPGATGSGSLKIVLPSPSGSRTVTANNGEGNLVRIQLVRDKVTVPLSGQNYLEQSLAGQTITLDRLPPGTDYQLYVSSGQLASSGFFETAYFQASSPFEITAGSSTSVSVTLNPTPFAVVEDSGSSYYHATLATGNNLYYIYQRNFNNLAGDPASASPTASLGIIPNGVTIYGLSYNSPGSLFWLNTSSGLWTSNGSAAFGRMSMLNSTGSVLSPVVYGSGLLSFTSGTTGGLAYYYGPGLTAGLASGSSYSASPLNSGVPAWSTFSDLLNLSSSLKTQLGSLDHAVSSVATDGSNFAYLSTGMGTYSLSASMLKSGDSALGTDLANGTDGSGHSILVSTKDGTLIGPVSVYSDGSSAYAFAGTTKGLFGAAVNPTSGLPTGDGKLALITSGLNITSLATSQYTVGSPYQAITAAYSSTTDEVLIFNNLTLVSRFPRLAGLPSGTPQFTWYTYNSGSTRTLYLVISGSDATVRLSLMSWSS